MTDSEKLDLLLTKIQEVDQKVGKLAEEQADMKKKIEKLALELTKTQSDLYKIDRKLTIPTAWLLMHLPLQPKTAGGLRQARAL